MLVSEQARTHNKGNATTSLVSLEALDAEPIRFWVLVMTALRQCGSYPPPVVDVALALLHSCEPPALTTVLTALIQQIEDTSPDAQTMLILDDYQVIDDPIIHESQTSQHLLEELERAHLFVVALDEQRHWYRFHGLFREVLLARLSARQPERVPLLHQRAAHWYDQQGDVHEAVVHAQATGDADFAACLLERYADLLWLNAGTMTVHHWILQLPDALLHVHAP